MTQNTKILSLSKYDAVRHGLAIVLKGLFHLNQKSWKRKKMLRCLNLASEK